MSLDQIRIYEGYPSLSWRLLFDSRARKPEQILELMRVGFSQIFLNRNQKAKLTKDSNLADAETQHRGLDFGI